MEQHRLFVPRPTTIKIHLQWSEGTGGWHVLVQSLRIANEGPDRDPDEYYESLTSSEALDVLLAVVDSLMSRPG